MLIPPRAVNGRPRCGACAQPGHVPMGGGGSGWRNYPPWTGGVRRGALPPPLEKAGVQGALPTISMPGLHLIGKSEFPAAAALCRTGVCRAETGGLSGPWVLAGATMR
jgi:hypothetical protein